jgi:hypothetical protein
MADTRAFNLYFANRTELPGEVAIAGDEIMVLRGGTVYRMDGAQVFAYASMNANAVETTINTIDVWVPIGGTLIQGVTAPTFTYAANAFTYIGVNQAGIQLLSAKMSISKAGGGDNIFEVGVFVNGVQEGTGMSVGASTALVGFVQTGNPHTLLTNDVIDMRIRNLSGNSNVTVLDAQLLIG